MRDEAGDLWFLLGDHLDSTSVAYRADGGQTSTQRYYAWGAVRPGPGNELPTDYTYTGQQVVESVGLLYYGARWYDAQLGRFCQPDTIVPQPGNPQDLYRFSFVRNNPFRYADPGGHEPGTPPLPSDGDAWLDWMEHTGLPWLYRVYADNGWGEVFGADFAEVARAYMGAEAAAHGRPDRWDVVADDIIARFPEEAQELGPFVKNVVLFDLIGEDRVGLGIAEREGQRLAEGQAAALEALFFVGVAGAGNGGAAGGGSGQGSSRTQGVWPKTAAEMDDMLGFEGERIPDRPDTPGRGKVVWRPSAELEVTYEQHPYHPGSPPQHSGPHWHAQWRGVRHARYLPGQSMPGTTVVIWP